MLTEVLVQAGTLVSDRSGFPAGAMPIVVPAHDCRLPRTGHDAGGRPALDHVRVLGIPTPRRSTYNSMHDVLHWLPDVPATVPNLAGLVYAARFRTAAAAVPGPGCRARTAGPAPGS